MAKKIIEKARKKPLKKVVKKEIVEEIKDTPDNLTSEIEPEIKKETRGRAPKDFLNKFDFQPIDTYYNENKVNPTEEKKSTETFGESSGLNNSPETEIKTEKTVESVMIEITPEKLELIESVFDAVLIKIVGVLGFNIELEPMSEKELKVWAQITPPINLERSWKNAMFYFLLIKLAK